MEHHPERQTRVWWRPDIEVLVIEKAPFHQVTGEGLEKDVFFSRASALPNI